MLSCCQPLGQKFFLPFESVLRKAFPVWECLQYISITTPRSRALYLGAIFDANPQILSDFYQTATEADAGVALRASTNRP